MTLKTILFLLVVCYGLLIILATIVDSKGNFKEIIKDEFSKLPDNSVLIGLVFLFIIIFIVISIGVEMNFYSKNINRIGILTEAHGLIFDLIVFGCLLAWFDQRREKRGRIEHYKNEIDDFRDWNSQEASHKIVGNIKRLQRERFFNIDLQACNFIGVKINNFSYAHSILDRAWFIGSNLHQVEFKNSSLRGVLFSNTVLSDFELKNFELIYQLVFEKGSKLFKIDFSHSHLDGCQFRNGTLIGINFSQSSLQFCDFMETKLRQVKFVNTLLFEVNFENLEFENIDFTGANICECYFSKVKGLTYEMLSRAESVYNCKMDNALLEEIKRKKPELLNKKNI